MRIERIDARGRPVEEVAAQLRGLAPAPASVADAVAGILADVRRGGDAALRELSRRFDGVEPGALEVDLGALDAGGAAARPAAPADPSVLAALDAAYAAVFEVAAAWVDDRPREVRPPGGARVVLREVPVTSAAIYVPGGRAPYPSTVVMGVAAARAAGVADLRVLTPPPVHPLVAAVCARLAPLRLFAVGGAQAIAAAAYGTESVPAVDVVVGPGNLYVAEAKRQVFGSVGIDSLAGPSDLLVVLSEGADLAAASRDLLAQAEHGPATLVVAAADRPELLDGLRLAAPLEPAAVALVLAEDPVELAGAFAPEHLQLMGEGAEARAAEVRTAGCTFVGNAAGTAFGDYVAGSNHVLPTGGAARYASMLNPGHFRRRTAEVRVPDAAALAPAGAAIARAEGFAWHARSMEGRIET